MSEDGENVDIGSAIRLLRQRANLTQRALAEQSELSRSALSRIENGHVEPTWGSLRRIARGLNVPLEDLIREAERAGLTGRESGGGAGKYG